MKIGEVVIVKFANLLWNYYQLSRIYDVFVQDIDFSEFKNVYNVEEMVKLQRNVSSKIYDALWEMRETIFDIIDHKCVEVDTVPDNGNHFKIVVGSTPIECLISDGDVYIKMRDKWYKYNNGQI